MIGSLSLKQVQSRLGVMLNARLFGESVNFHSVCTDTRQLGVGDLFVALRGPRFDGHEFLQQAHARGAVAALVDSADGNCPIPQLQVDDTVLGLGQLALMNRRKFTEKVVAITGSSGKTTVRTMTDSILRQRGPVLCTTGNLNNHIGVPLTLLRLDGTETAAVIEMGASGIGEIAYLCELAEPDVVLVNNVMPAHLEGFGSLEGVADAKGEIYQGVKEGGTCVVNLDERFAPQWLEEIGSKKVLSFSLARQDASCYASDIRSAGEGVAFTLNLDGQAMPVALSSAGTHMVANALAAACCARAMGASHENIVAGLESCTSVAGRMHRARGPHNCLLIDDTYNANPGSVKAAIDVLAGCAGARILVMGDMGELGDEAWLMHAEIGDYATEKKLDAVFTVGSLSQAISEEFNGPARHFHTQQALIEHLFKVVTGDDFSLLIKGSRSAHMDKVVSALTLVETN